MVNVKDMPEPVVLKGMQLSYEHYFDVCERANRKPLSYEEWEKAEYPEDPDNG